MPKQPKPRGRSTKKPPPPEPGSMSEVARAHGKSVSVLRRAIETGGVPGELFPAGPDGRRTVTDFSAASEAFGEYLKNPPPLGRPRAEKGPSVVSVSLGAIEMPPGFDVENPETWPLDLDGLKVVREWWIARHAKRKDDVASGELLRTEDVRRELFGASRVCRDHIQRIPHRVSEDLSAALGAVDAETVRRVLTSSIERVLDDLSSALLKTASQEPIRGKVAQDDATPGATRQDNATTGDEL